MASFFRLVVEIHVLQKTSDMNETKFCKSFKNTENNDNAFHHLPQVVLRFYVAL